VAAAAAAGFDLSTHRARQATAVVLEEYDLVYGMAAVHRDGVLETVPGMAGRVHLLDPGGRDVMDPYGLDAEAYRFAWDHIATGVAARAPDWGP
jgi:protein-tyrosine-phosphatase